MDLADATDDVRVPSGIPVSDADPFSHAFFEDPFPTHAALRDAGPVVWLSRWNCFAVARYTEVFAALSDPETFCSRRGVGLADFAKDIPWRPPSLILESDPPEHARPRGVLSQTLSIGALRAYRPQFAAAAETLVDSLLARKTFDGITDLAEAFPMSVFPDALGLCPEGREHLLPYASLVFNAVGPSNDLREQAIARSMPHVSYVTAQCQRDALAPGSLGAQVHASVDSGTLKDEEAALLVRSLLSAGLDTTVHGIAAALDCLTRFPDQWDRLKDDPTLARNAFEEAVRMESPVQAFFRTTTRATELGGVALPADAKVLLFFSAANRDPRRWENPDAYDITRRVSGHVGFGGGSHMCVGQFVARLEGEVLLETLARKVDGLRRTGPAVRLHNNSLRGLEHLPLAVTS
jgi:cytochrome P450